MPGAAPDYAALLGRSANGLVERNSGGSPTFYDFDPQGNVSQRLSSTGAVQSTDSYGPFGTNATTHSDVFQYGGQWGYQSEGTGLYLAGMRLYDETQGRFLNRDPARYLGGENLYGYVGNDPVDMADPTGLDPNDLEDGPIPGSLGGEYGGAFGQGLNDLLNSSPFAPGSTQRTAISRDILATPVIGAALGGYEAATGCDPVAGEPVGALNRGLGGLAAVAPFLGAFLGAAADAGDVGGQDLITVSRWGRPGLQSGDWVMKGPANRLNYILSGKWQPGFGNEYATFGSGNSYLVPAGSIGPPPIEPQFSQIGFGAAAACLKWALRQRVYLP